MSKVNTTNKPTIAEKLQIADGAKPWQFKKGQKYIPGSGRKKGSSGKLQESIRLIFRELISTAEFKELWWTVLHSKDEYVRMDALRLATQYMFGRPAQTPINVDDQASAENFKFDYDSIVTRHVPVQ